MTSQSRPRISVVVPALNEESNLPWTLETIVGASVEIIVVDGGSQDATAIIARKGGARVVDAPRGRAIQMNAGAREALGDILLFLHADSLLPPGAIDAACKAMEDPQVLGGCFQLRFDAEGESLALYLYGLCTRLWLFRTPRLVYGDRGIFVRKSTFEALGGYSEVPLLEDLDFAFRLSRFGGRRCFAFVPSSIVTSARRLLEVGPLRQQLLNIGVTFLWYVGVSPKTLRTWYDYNAPKKPALSK